jgi:hypothetical protein
MSNVYVILRNQIFVIVLFLGRQPNIDSLKVAVKYMEQMK